MKEILYVMRLDFISVRSTAIGMITILGTLAVLASFFVTPFAAILVLEFLPIILIGPLQTFDSKYGFHKLYGILPIQRKSITRGRFALYAVMFLCIQLFVTLLVTAAVYADLNELMPVNSSFLQEQQFAFEPEELPSLLGMCTLMPMFFCFIFVFMEMAGQIFGRENEMKIFLISGIVVVGLIIAILTLTDAGILPYFEIPEFPQTIPGVIRFAVIGDIAVGLLCAAFSEITAHVAAKREL